MPKVIITGAAGGIGISFCKIFFEAGYDVIGVDIKPIKCEFPIQTLQYDISNLGQDSKEGKEFVKKIELILNGELDVLVNNAAIQIVEKVEDITFKDWDITMKTNLFAPLMLSQTFLPHLRKSKGSIINIASIHAYLTKPNFTLYSTSKGAMVTMTKALALELAPEIRVNAIIPAATDTPMLRAGFKGNLDALDNLSDCHPLCRIARPEEVAKVALFLASNDASFITGSTVNIDGGISSVLHDPILDR